MDATRSFPFLNLSTRGQGNIIERMKKQHCLSITLVDNIYFIPHKLWKTLLITRGER